MRILAGLKGSGEKDIMLSVFTVNFGLRFCFAFSLGVVWIRSSCDIWEGKIRQISVLEGKYANLLHVPRNHVRSLKVKSCAPKPSKIANLAPKYT